MADDDEEGRKERDEGIRRAGQHANPAWKRAVLECIRLIATNKQWFAVDDVETLRRKLFPGITTHEGRAMGPSMLDAARQGWIMRTQDYTPTRIAAHHMTPRVVWWSLIYKGPAPRSPPRKRKISDPRQLGLGL